MGEEVRKQVLKQIPQLLESTLPDVLISGNLSGKMHILLELKTWEVGWVSTIRYPGSLCLSWNRNPSKSLYSHFISDSLLLEALGCCKASLVPSRIFTGSSCLFMSYDPQENWNAAVPMSWVHIAADLAAMK